MPRRRKKAFAPSEDDITVAVLSHWLILGVPGSLVAAIPNKRAFGQAGLTPGLPDLLVISPKLGRVTAYLELKTDDGRPSKNQLAVRAFMAMRDIPYVVTYGRDEPIKILEQWGALRTQASHAGHGGALHGTALQGSAGQGEAGQGKDSAEAAA